MFEDIEGRACGWLLSLKSRTGFKLEIEILARIAKGTFALQPQLEATTVLDRLGTSCSYLIIDVVDVFFMLNQPHLWIG